MFDFWKEVIINSEYLPIEDGTDNEGNPLKRFSAIGPDDLEKYEGVHDPVFRVLRCADYKTKYVADEGKFYMTPGNEGERGGVVIPTSEVPSAGAYRFVLDLSLAKQHYCEFARPWLEPHKSIIADFVTTGNAEEDLKNLYNALKLAVENTTIAKVFFANTSGGNTITIILSDPYIKIDKCVLQALTGENNCDLAYTTVTELPFIENVEPFATGEWLVENLRFPTIANRRYTAEHTDEMPIPGMIYTQFTFDYTVPRRGLTGQGAVGQTLTSTTHHVFYVREGLEEKFKTALETAGLSLAE